MKITLPKFPIEGGCACGAVRYRLTAAPATIYTCHCTDCQKLTTAAFTLTMPVRRESLEILRGELKTWIRTPPSGNRLPQHVCSHCGVRIYSEPAGAPATVSLRCGTLDDTRWIRPVAAIWMKSAQPWVCLPDDVMRFDETPDFGPLIAAFKERTQAP